MNLQQLYYFKKIAECQQYTKAADELHVTQAALSYAISNLEQELEVKLFDRKGRNLLLTPCGEAYLACVRDAIQALDRGERMVKNLSRPAKAVIRLFYLDSLQSLIPTLISELYPENTPAPCQFDLANYTIPMIEQQLIHREVDLAISTAPTVAGISSHLIGYQDYVIIVPSNHPWAELESVPLSALNGQRLITYSRDCFTRKYYDFILESAHVHPEIFAEAQFDNNILDMVIFRLGVAIVPKTKFLERADLHVISIQDKIPPRAVYLLWASDAVLSPEAEDCRQRIIQNTDLSKYL